MTDDPEALQASVNEMHETLAKVNQSLGFPVQATRWDDEPGWIDGAGRGHWTVAEHYEVVGDPTLPLVTHTLPGSMSPNLAGCFAEVLPAAAQWTARTCTEMRARA